MLLSRPNPQDESVHTMTQDTKKVIYSMVGVGKYVNSKPILKDIYLSYFYGAKIGVVGANGSGKSTLLRIMAGVDSQYVGETVLSEGYSVGFLQQEPELDPTKTVREIVGEGVAETEALLKEFDEINAKFGEVMDDDEMTALIERQGEVQEKIDLLNAWDLDAQLEMAMDALRCPAGDTPVRILSGGEKRRVALCRLLLQKPDILLLDEPTNHLDAETVQWLEHHLQEYHGTVIAVTHDRYFLNNVAGWILELDNGEGVPWKGNYSSWLDQKQQKLQKKNKDASEQIRALIRELEWVQMSPKKRAEQAKSHLSNYEFLLQDKDEQRAKTKIYIPPGPRLGKTVIEAQHLSKAYGDRLLIEDLSFMLPQGGIVGIIGPNGAGKTTLFKMISGKETPDSGTISIGETVKLAYVDQERDILNPNLSVWEMISGGSEVIELGGQLVNSRAYVSRFNLSGQAQQKKCGDLSGGERNRVHLALVLKEQANVLLLDEPTNDLDIHTIRELEEALSSFAGCALIISHDRWFLDRVATHILAFEGDSQVIWFPGNYSEYEADRRARLGDEADRPHRIRYRQLTR